jgi:dihydrofolate reductase
MMKLTTVTMITLDGVLQGLGGAQEDHRGGFERGGWLRNASDDESRAALTEIYARADAFLFGRWTYDLFAGYWGTIQDPDDPFGGPLNRQPKYVASNTLSEATWPNTTVLSGDVAAAVRESKAKPGGELQVHGSGALVRWLLANDLVDEMILFVCPVIVGQGSRLYPENGPDTALDLVGSRSTPNGVTIQTYRPTGRPQYASAGS